MKKNNENQSNEKSLPLADVKWLQLGDTDEYEELKKRIAHVLQRCY